MRLASSQAVFVRSMGKALRVTAVFVDVDAANAFMAKNPDDAVIAEYGGAIFLANVHDKGIPLPKEPS